MLYLADANVLIRAQGDYYPIERIPQFWNWLRLCAEQGVIKLPHEIFEEIAAGKDSLTDWLVSPEVATVIKYAESVNPVVLNQVLSHGYAPDLNDSELEEVGQDPFLIAYALTNPAGITVVSKEVSAPSKQRANRRVPDVCKTLGVRCINDFELYRELQFSVS